MKSKLRLSLTPVILSVFVGSALAQAPAGLTSLDRIAGWKALFDGQTTDGWRRWRGVDFPRSGWEVQAGTLHHTKGGGDLISTERFLDFELELDWRVAAGANSGIKYRVVERPDAGGAIAPEYQVLDDSAHPKELANQKAASLYAIAQPAGAALAPVGDWNHTRIVARGKHIEHWLNGIRVLQAEIGSDMWNASKASSKFKDAADFGEKRGHILLQDHGDEVWYKNIRIRDLSQPAGEAALIYDGFSLDGWFAKGNAIYDTEPDGIHGQVGGGAQSFLITEETYHDFILEADIKLEDQGNSGIQIRSHLRDNGRLFGYQIEIDPSERSWSAGLYDEARRGWLDDLSDNAAARQAFDGSGWNHYRIEAIGPWIRSWVNGVPAADYLDAMDLEGHIALQVHSGNNTNLRWRDLSLQDLGAHKWGSLLAIEAFTGWIPESMEGGSPWTRTAELLTRDPSKTSARLTSTKTIGELCAKFDVRGAGELLVGLRQVRKAQRWGIGSGTDSGADSGADSDTPAEKPALVETDRGWFARIPLGSDPEKWQHITLYSYGDRLALDVNDKRIEELHDIRIAPEGHLLFEHVGTQPLELKDMAIVERKRRR